MNKQLQKLKKKFIPYYNVWISNKNRKKIRTIKTTSVDVLTKHRLSKYYISSEYVNFEQYVMRWLKNQYKS